MLPAVLNDPQTKQTFRAQNRKYKKEVNRIKNKADMGKDGFFSDLKGSSINHLDRVWPSIYYS